MDQFTAIVPCYDGIEKHSIGRKLSYQLFYRTQYPPMREKLIYNLSASETLSIITDFSTTNFSSYTPLFGPVIDALVNSKSIDQVIILGDERVIRQAFEYSGNNPDITILDRKHSIGTNLFSSDTHYDIDRYVFICMPDIPLITSSDVDRLILTYLENSDINYHDLITGLVPQSLYFDASDIDKKFF